MHKLGFVVVILYLRVFYHHKSIVWFFFPLPSQQSHKLIILPTHSCSRPRQMPLESGTDNLSCAEAACPGLSEASHSGQEVLSLGAHCSITPSDTSSQPHKKNRRAFYPDCTSTGTITRCTNLCQISAQTWNVSSNQWECKPGTRKLRERWRDTEGK